MIRWDKHILEQVLEQPGRWVSDLSLPLNYSSFLPHQINLIRLMVFDHMEKYHTGHMLLIALYLQVTSLNGRLGYMEESLIDQHFCNVIKLITLDTV